MSAEAILRASVYRSLCKESSNAFCAILPTGASLVVVALNAMMQMNVNRRDVSDATMDALMNFARWLNCIGNCLLYANMTWLRSVGKPTSYHRWAEEFCDPKRPREFTHPPPEIPPAPRPKGPVTPSEGDTTQPASSAPGAGPRTEPDPDPVPGAGGPPSGAAPTPAPAAPGSPPAGAQPAPGGPGQAAPGSPPAGPGDSPPGPTPPPTPPPPPEPPPPGGGGSWKASPEFASLGLFPSEPGPNAFERAFDRDLAGLTTQLADEMRSAAEELIRERTAASGTDGFAVTLATLCCKAMAWAEQVSAEACADHVCGRFEQPAPGLHLGALTTASSVLRREGYPMPSAWDSQTMFVDLITDVSRTQNWKRRFEFGASLCP